MTETEFGILKPERQKPLLPETEIIRVPYREKVLTARYPRFTGYSFDEVCEKMKEPLYFSSQESRISFREPSTEESLSIQSYLNDAFKPQASFGTDALYLGRIVKVADGFYVLGAKYSHETYLDVHEYEEADGVFFGQNGSGFVPYSSFKVGEQDKESFLKSGLARVLEHTKGEAENFRSLFKTHRSEVIVGGFEPTEKPTERVVLVSSYPVYANHGPWLLGHKLMIDECPVDRGLITETGVGMAWGILD